MIYLLTTNKINPAPPAAVHEYQRLGRGEVWRGVVKIIARNVCENKRFCSHLNGACVESNMYAVGRAGASGFELAWSKKHAFPKGKYALAPSSGGALTI